MSSVVNHPTREQLLEALKDFREKKYKSLRQTAEAHNLPCSSLKHQWSQLRTSGALAILDEEEGESPTVAAATPAPTTTAQEADKSGSQELPTQPDRPARPTKEDVDKAKVRAYELYRSGVGGSGFRATVNKVKVETGVSVDRRVLRRMVEKLGPHDPDKELPPAPRRGRAPALLPHDEEELVKYITLLRLHRLPVLKEEVLARLNALVRGTEYEKAFKGGQASDGWYYSFLDRHELTTRAMRPLEVSRAAWGTAANAFKMYEVASDVFVKAHVAIPNPDFKEDEPYSAKVLITRPDMIFRCVSVVLRGGLLVPAMTTTQQRLLCRFRSFDQTDVSLSTMDAKERTATIKPSRGEAGGEPEFVDEGHVMATKTSKHYSACGGSTASGRSLVPLIIHPGTTLDATTLEGFPTTNFYSDVTKEDGTVKQGNLYAVSLACDEGRRVCVLAVVASVLPSSPCILLFFLSPQRSWQHATQCLRVGACWQST